MERLDMTRFMGRIEHRDGHWIWPYWTGHGKRWPGFWHEGRNVNARRVAWQLRYGEAPNVPLWRTCDEPHCINPEHNDPRIGRPPEDTCRRGHRLTDDNVYITTAGSRACKICVAEKGKERRERYAREGRGWGRSYRPLSDADKVKHEQHDDDDLAD